VKLALVFAIGDAPLCFVTGQVDLAGEDRTPDAVCVFDFDALMADGLG
jgi:hypothetical protein